MSGQASGWVLRHGPKDRALRAILLVIADAANADGEHAHPGIDTIVDGSLYSRSTVYAALDRLATDQWIVVEQAGGGRGHPTVWAIPGVREWSEKRSSHRTVKESSHRTLYDGKGPERVQKGSSLSESAPYIGTNNEELAWAREPDDALPPDELKRRIHLLRKHPETAKAEARG